MGLFWLKPRIKEAEHVYLDSMHCLIMSLLGWSIQIKTTADQVFPCRWKFDTAGRWRHIWRAMAATTRGTETALPVALTIATSDSGGGAGIQADLLSMTANGAFGVTAIAALTAQSPREVTAIETLPPAFLLKQLETLFSYFQIRAAKTGMLFSAELIEAVAGFMRGKECPLVVDPVMVATSGAVLLEPSALDALRHELFPLATLITPNLDEVEVLLGWKPAGRKEMLRSGQELSTRYGAAILMKGGHLSGDELIDILVHPDGTSREWRGQRIAAVNTHGSGCSLSASIAAGLAKGLSLDMAVSRARTYLRKTLIRTVEVSGETFAGRL